MRKNELSPDEHDQLARLAALPDDQIDTADIPEIPPENWSHARRGGLCRRYVAEFDFRHNHRARLGLNDAMRAEAALRVILGKRLTYRTAH